MFKSINKVFRHETMRLYSAKTTEIKQTITSQATSTPVIKDVSGLSEKCVAVPQQSISPHTAKDKEYKNPEYYCYHVDSFAEAEVELAKFRLPVPSNKRK